MRFGFWLKLAMTILLVVAFDWLFPASFSGACIGIFALAWIAALVIVQPALRRSPPAWIALAVALYFSAALVDDPGPLAWAMFWGALSVAALLPRTRGFDDAWRWLVRVLLHGLSGLVAPILDLTVLLRRPRRGGRITLSSLAALLAVPVLGSLLFLSLFTIANPVIAHAFDSLTSPSPLRLLVWLLVAICVWPSFRPRALVTRLVAAMPDPELRLPGTSLPSVLIALGLFNLLFAIQNGLDIAFLWSGASLPPGVTLASYAHSGAYPLIVTALLAGAFVLVTLRPGSASANSPLARRLVVLWVAQNLFLVASSVLRTVDYIEVYLLTAWRIAALVWMALVAVGLVLICWRMLAGRSARWLINANALAAGLVLAGSSVVDFEAIAAGWNVRNAREVGGRGTAIDLCYLHDIGAPALLPLIELEQRRLIPAFRDRVRYVRQQILRDVEDRQRDWDRWTPRDARRLDRAYRLIGPTRPQAMALRSADYWRNCDGTIGHVAMPADMKWEVPEPAAPTVTTPDQPESLTKGAAR